MLLRIAGVCAAALLVGAPGAHASNHSTLRINGVCEDGGSRWSAAVTVKPADGTLKIKLSGRAPFAQAFGLVCGYSCDLGTPNPDIGCPIVTDDKGKFTFETTIVDPPPCAGLSPFVIIGGGLCRFISP
jgi:hypothetical protein